MRTIVSDPKRLVLLKPRQIGRARFNEFARVWQEAWRIQREMDERAARLTEAEMRRYFAETP